MEHPNKIQLFERCLFVVLLIGLGMAGFLYEKYDGTVEVVLLVPSLIAYMLVCYAIYRGLMWLAVKRFTSED